MFAFEIGPADNPQFAGLVEPDWYNRFGLPGIPKDTNWHVVLVDLQPSVIIWLLEKFQGTSNLTILNAAVGSTGFSPVESTSDYSHVGWETRLSSAAKYNDKNQAELHPCFHIYTVDLATLLSFAGDNEVGLLSLDAQGAEVEILMGYDFNIRPRFIEIEVHSEESFSIADNILRSNDYQLIREVSEEYNVTWFPRCRRLYGDLKRQRNII